MTSLDSIKKMENACAHLAPNLPRWDSHRTMIHHGFEGNSHSAQLWEVSGDTDIRQVKS